MFLFLKSLPKQRDLASPCFCILKLNMSFSKEKHLWNPIYKHGVIQWCVGIFQSVLLSPEAEFDRRPVPCNKTYRGCGILKCWKTCTNHSITQMPAIIITVRGYYTEVETQCLAGNVKFTRGCGECLATLIMKAAELKHYAATYGTPYTRDIECLIKLH